MDNREQQPSLIRRRVNDLVLAEMFLLQATIESANAIGDGIQNLADGESGRDFSSLLENTLDNAIEPYAARYRYYRELMQKDG